MISRHCIYHATLPARVVDFDEFNNLLKSNEWFDSPLLPSTKEEIKNGKERETNEGHSIISSDQGNLRDPNVGKSCNEGSTHENGTGATGQDLRESEIPIKRRGRPKKV